MTIKGMILSYEQIKLITWDSAPDIPCMHVSERELIDQEANYTGTDHDHLFDPLMSDFSNETHAFDVLYPINRRTKHSPLPEGSDKYSPTMSIHTPANAYRRRTDGGKKDMKWADSAYRPLRIIQHPEGGGGSPGEWLYFVARRLMEERRSETERFAEGKRSDPWTDKDDEDLRKKLESEKFDEPMNANLIGYDVQAYILEWLDAEGHQDKSLC